MRGRGGVRLVPARRRPVAAGGGGRPGRGRGAPPRGAGAARTVAGWRWTGSGSPWICFMVPVDSANTVSMRIGRRGGPGLAVGVRRVVARLPGVVLLAARRRPRGCWDPEWVSGGPARSAARRRSCPAGSRPGRSRRGRPPAPGRRRSSARSRPATLPATVPNARRPRRARSCRTGPRCVARGSVQGGRDREQELGAGPPLLVGRLDRLLAGAVQHRAQALLSGWPLTRRHPRREVLVAGLVVALVAVGVLRGVRRAARRRPACAPAGRLRRRRRCAPAPRPGAAPSANPSRSRMTPSRVALMTWCALPWWSPSSRPRRRGAEDGRGHLQPPEAAVRQVAGRVVQRLHCLVDHRLVDDEIGSPRAA